MTTVPLSAISGSSETIRRIQLLRDRTNVQNWDQMGAEPVPSESLDMIERFALLVALKSGLFPAISAGSAGVATLEWRWNGHEVYVEIFRDQTTEWLIDEGDYQAGSSAAAETALILAFSKEAAE